MKSLVAVRTLAIALVAMIALSLGMFSVASATPAAPIQTEAGVGTSQVSGQAVWICQYMPYLKPLC